MNFNKGDLLYVKNKGIKKIGIVLDKYKDPTLKVYADKIIYRVIVDNKITTYLNYHLSKIE
tara:strand:+ start:1031 stop:1213 length:183 start_codon:yes stop_codon:yes gene_type:complete